jgi:hypothetical protein
MRTGWLALLACLTLGMLEARAARAPRQGAPAKAAGKPLSDYQRGRVAQRTIVQQVRLSLRSTERLEARTELRLHGGDAPLPITGHGPIEVHVEIQPKEPVRGWQGFKLRHFNPRTRRVFLVNVDLRGNVTPLGERSLAFQYRLGRRLSFGLPIVEIADDLYNSPKVREGAFTFTLASLGHLPGLLLGLPKAFVQVRAGLTARSQDRQKALEATINWLHRRNRSTEGVPTLDDAYEHYKGVLRKNTSQDVNSFQKARPVSLMQFASQLADRHF